MTYPLRAVTAASGLVVAVRMSETRRPAPHPARAEALQPTPLTGHNTP